MVENIRNFYEDLMDSNNQHIRSAWIKLLKLKFGSDCQISMEDNIKAQKGFGTDLIVITNRGRRYSIELKTRNYACYHDPLGLGCY